MFGIGGSSAGAKKKGKQATKGDAQIVKDNAETIEFYKKVLTIVNAVFLGVHLIFYFITGFPTYSFILFAITSGIAWYVWSFMKQIGSASAGGGVTDLNLEGSISEYAKDIILVISLTQVTSLIHRYFWWLLLVIPLYAAYKGIMLFFFSPYAQLRGGGNQEQEAEQDNKKGKRIVRVVRH